MNRIFDTPEPEPFPWDEAGMFAGCIHPVCQTVPMPGAAEIERLGRSLYEVGQIHPVTFWKSPETNDIYFIDGRVRVSLLAALGIDPVAQVISCEQDELVAWFHAVNLTGRRLPDAENDKIQAMFKDKLRRSVAGIKSMEQQAKAMRKTWALAIGPIREIIETKRTYRKFYHKLVRVLNADGQMKFVEALLEDPKQRRWPLLDRIAGDSRYRRPGTAGMVRHEKRVAFAMHVELTTSELRSKYGNTDAKGMMSAELATVCASLREEGFRANVKEARPLGI